jgi:hypothetical protein
LIFAATSVQLSAASVVESPFAKPAKLTLGRTEPFLVRVQDEQGAPLSGCYVRQVARWVRALGEFSSLEVADPSYSMSTPTKPGLYPFPFSLSGKTIFAATCESGVETDREEYFTVLPEGPRELTLTFATKGVDLSGTVTDEKGKAVAGLALRATHPNDGSACTKYVGATRSDGDGGFRISGLMPKCGYVLECGDVSFPCALARGQEGPLHFEWPLREVAPASDLRLRMRPKVPALK